MTAQQGISARNEVSRHFSSFLTIFFLSFTFATGCRSEIDDQMALLFGIAAGRTVLLSGTVS